MSELSYYETIRSHKRNIPTSKKLVSNFVHIKTRIFRKFPTTKLFTKKLVFFAKIFKNSELTRTDELNFGSNS